MSNHKLAVGLEVQLIRPDYTYLPKRPAFSAKLRTLYLTLLSHAIICPNLSGTGSLCKWAEGSHVSELRLPLEPKLALSLWVASSSPAPHCDGVKQTNKQS
jgi:hypothetical protein